MVATEANAQRRPSDVPTVAVPRDAARRPMPGKVPQEKNDKKKGKSLKEKREVKKQKKAGR
jgi:hypothetical protein